jgi:hypothetical protein
MPSRENQMKRKNAHIKLVRAAKKVLKQQEFTTDGVNWRRSGAGDELDAAIRREKFTRLRGRR